MDEVEERIVRMSLEKLLESIDIEITHTELRLKILAEELGLKSYKDLEKTFKEGPENPKIDLTWPEYLYLKDKLEKLKRDREEVLKQLAKREHIAKTN